MGIVRLLLALSVMLSHSGSWLGLKLVPSPVAVQVFFIISGFYMALVLRGKYKAGGGRRIFYHNRFLKLFPAYWAVLAFTVATSVFSGLVWHDWSVLGAWKELGQTLSFPAAVFLVCANLFMFGQDVVMYTGLNTHTGTLFFAKDFWHTNPQVWTFLLVPQAWSLALELMFYLIAPFLVRLRIVALGALILATLLLRSYISQQLRLTGDPWSYRFFPTELGLFLLGILSHSVFVERPVDPYVKKVCGVFGVLLIVVTVLYSFLSQGDESFRWVYFTIAFLGIPAIFDYSKTSKIDRALGDLSYPLYISHYGVFEAVKRVSEHTHARWLNVDVEYVCAFIVAYLLNRYVIERLEVRRRAPAQTV